MWMSSVGTKVLTRNAFIQNDTLDEMCCYFVQQNICGAHLWNKIIVHFFFPTKPTVNTFAHLLENKNSKQKTLFSRGKQGRLHAAVKAPLAASFLKWYSSFRMIHSSFGLQETHRKYQQHQVSERATVLCLGNVSQVCSKHWATCFSLCWAEIVAGELLSSLKPQP